MSKQTRLSKAVKELVQDGVMHVSQLDTEVKKHLLFYAFSEMSYSEVFEFFSAGVEAFEDELQDIIDYRAPTIPEPYDVRHTLREMGLL